MPEYCVNKNAQSDSGDHEPLRRQMGSQKKHTPLSGINTSEPQLRVADEPFEARTSAPSL